MLQRLLMSVLVGLYPCLVFASNNWYVFSARQTLLLIVCVGLGGLVVLGSLTLLVQAVLTLAARLRGKVGANTRVVDCVHAFTGLTLCLLFIQSDLRPLPIPSVLLWIAAALILVAGSVAAYRFGLARVNGVLLALTLLTLVQWGAGFLSIQAKQETDRWHNAGRSLNDAVEFRTKPNVYFIVAESYPSAPALETIFNNSNSAFYDELAEQGFAVHDGAFSNYPDTLSSLASIFAMTHHYMETEAGNRDSYSGRDLISAKIYNAVVDIFRRNGYWVQYIHQMRYQMKQGANLDFHWPRASQYAALKGFLKPVVRARWLNSWGLRDIPYEKSFFRTLRTRLEAIPASGRPNFTYIYIKHPEHSPPLEFRKRPNMGLKAMRRYRYSHPRRVERANAMLLEILEQIRANDPDPVIVIAGDHGSFGKRMGLEDDGTRMPDRDIALDRLGILLATRFPGDFNETLRGVTISGANVFRYVFAYLADDDSILDSKTPDDGFIRNGILKENGTRILQAIRAGSILDEFADFHPPQSTSPGESAD